MLCILTHESLAAAKEPRLWRLSHMLRMDADISNAVREQHLYVAHHANQACVRYQQRGSLLPIPAKCGEGSDSAMNWCQQEINIRGYLETGSQLFSQEGGHGHAIAKAGVQHAVGISHHTEALGSLPVMIAAQRIGTPLVRIGVVQGFALLYYLHTAPRSS